MWLRRASSRTVLPVINNKKPTAISISRVVTHGKTGAANGISSHRKNDKRKFRHVFEFANTKCKTLSKVTTYHG